MTFQRLIRIMLMGTLLFQALPARCAAVDGAADRTDRFTAQALSTPAAWTLRALEGVSDWHARQWAPVRQYREDHPLFDDLFAIFQHALLGFGMNLQIVVETYKNEVDACFALYPAYPNNYVFETDRYLLDANGLTWAVLLPYNALSRKGSWEQRLVIASTLAQRNDRVQILKMKALFTVAGPYAKLTRFGIALVQLRRAERIATTAPPSEWIIDARGALSTLQDETLFADSPNQDELLRLRREALGRLLPMLEDGERQLSEAARANTREKKIKVAPDLSMTEALGAQWKKFRANPKTKPDQVGKFFQSADWNRQSVLWRFQHLETWTFDWFNQGIAVTTASADILRLMIEALRDTLKDPEGDLLPENLAQPLNDLFISWLNNPSPAYSRMNALYKLQTPSPLRRAVETIGRGLPGLVGQYNAALLHAHSAAVDEKFHEHEVLAFNRGNPILRSDIEALRNAFNDFLGRIPAALTAAFAADLEAFNERLSSLQAHPIVETSA